MQNEKCCKREPKFYAERLMRLHYHEEDHHGYVEEQEETPALCGVSVAAVSATQIVFTIDESDYYLTAAQACELARHFLSHIIIYSARRRYACKAVSDVLREKLEFQIEAIDACTSLAEEDFLNLSDYILDIDQPISIGAFGSRISGAETPYYDLFISLNDALGIPWLGIEDRIFTLEFDEMLWMAEQLSAAAYLLVTHQCTGNSSV